MRHLMKTNQLQKNSVRLVPRTPSGMTLMEVVVALAITGLAVGGIVGGYAFCTTSAEKAALSLAASARAMERLEETRSAKWDLSTWPTVDQLVPTNFPDKVVTLDLSGSGAGATSARVLTEIFLISTDPPLKQIRAHCIWTFQGERLTNTIETCRAPDQ
jgi:prepilin-type N-terminal cleavage/methylation domain-containing protein